jgi:hypothetical protein
MRTLADVTRREQQWKGTYLSFPDSPSMSDTITVRERSLAAPI